MKTAHNLFALMLTTAIALVIMIVGDEVLAYAANSSENMGWIIITTWLLTLFGAIAAFGILIVNVFDKDEIPFDLQRAQRELYEEFLESQSVLYKDEAGRNGESDTMPICHDSSPHRTS